MYKQTKDFPSEFDFYEAGELVVGYKDFEHIQLYRVHICTPPSIAGQNSTLSIADKDDQRHSVNADDVKPLQQALDECGANDGMQVYLRSQITSVDPLPLAQKKVEDITIRTFEGGRNLDFMKDSGRYFRLLIEPTLKDYGCQVNNFHNGVSQETLMQTASRYTPWELNDPSSPPTHL